MAFNSHKGIVFAFIFAIFLTPLLLAQEPWFTDVAVGYNVTGGNDETWSCSWADYDRDGDEDLLITNQGSTPYYRLFKNHYPDPFEPLSPFGNLPYFSYCAVWGDYNNDGYLDVYF